MKWIAKRVLLKSMSHAKSALVNVVDPFVGDLQNNNYISGWYCSCKSESGGTKPSIRIYLKIFEVYEHQILEILKSRLNSQKESVGWTGKFIYPDPRLPDSNKLNLPNIQAACEIALVLLKRYPDSQSYSSLSFQYELSFLIRSNESLEQDREAIHFIANNLLVDDLWIWHILTKKDKI